MNLLVRSHIHNKIHWPPSTRQLTSSFNSTFISQFLSICYMHAFGHTEPSVTKSANKARLPLILWVYERDRATNKCK